MSAVSRLPFTPPPPPRPTFSAISGTAKEDDKDDEDKKDAKAAPEAPSDSDDEEDHNMEFTSSDHETRLFFNRHTKQIRLRHVKTGDEELLEVKSKETTKAVKKPGEEELEEELDLPKDDVKRTGGGDDSVMPSGIVSQQDAKAPIPVDAMIRSILLVSSHINSLAERGEVMNEMIKDDLKVIQERLSNLQTNVQASTEMPDLRNDVDCMLDYPKLPWSFQNKWVNDYRAGAVRQPHELSQDWYMPQYFSDIALPAELPDTVTVAIHVSAAFIGDPKMTDRYRRTEFKITSKDTVGYAIRRAREESQSKSTAPLTDFVLKAYGFREYMDFHEMLYKYAYVRQCLRDGKLLEFILVKKPEKALPPLTNYDHAALYRNRASLHSDARAPIREDAYTLLPKSVADINWETTKVIPFQTMINSPFRIRVNGLDNVSVDSLPRLKGENGMSTHLMIECFLFHGLETLEHSKLQTDYCEYSTAPRFYQLLEPHEGREIFFGTLPREVRLGFYVSAKVNDSKPFRVGWSVLPLFDEHGELVSGKVPIRIWPFEGKKKGKSHGKKRDDATNPTFIQRSVPRDNWTTNCEVSLLTVEFDSYMYPVVAPLMFKAGEPNIKIVGSEFSPKNFNKRQVKLLESIIESDALYAMTNEEKELIWKIRHHLMKYPQLLPKVLQACNWFNVDYRNEMYKLLESWSPPPSALASLELLDVRYPDYRIRKYAIEHLKRMGNNELSLYLLQMVQCLKYESYHDSCLSRFLMDKSLAAPLEIGHHFFWHLKSEIHVPFVSERFGLLLEEYLSHCGHYSIELRKQVVSSYKLRKIAELIVKLKRENNCGDAEAMVEYRKEVDKLNQYFTKIGNFQVPYNPRLEVTTLIREKCRYMSSKMVPLWLVFNNNDDAAPPVYIMFKSGDDLRQDILTLQLLRVMDQIWLKEGIDLRLKPYWVISTGVNDEGEGVGMIEVVLNSDTTSGIQLKYGGGAMGALRLDPIDLFLHDHNKTKEAYEIAVENFVRSCAGYCVATYILGIGDRHNGNIMVTKDGHLFHIDFGHFLGNFKKKFGMNRERAAFVFTPEMAFVMGGKKYKNSAQFNSFRTFSFLSFKFLRQAASLLENLFILMVPAQMPELLVEPDITYMQKRLSLNVTEKKAESTLDQEIQKSLDSTYRRIDNMIHNLKHG
eukprot:TRINITY_DN5029_c0_g1_i1.p1 TRINITY_DN5029_c0_g1~~TRINITY_DN5029_c0_g1_i1.p1  ORF type:complete len:1166 (+),score=333.41 TRINITY_DN5029_c0_g1_i1:89-3586(+)